MTEYELWRRDSRSHSTWTKIATPPGPAQSELREVEVERPRLDLEYSFRVRAVNRLGAGPWSAIAQVQSETANLPPAPQNLTVVPSTPRTAKITWQMPPANGSQVVAYKADLQPADGSQAIGCGSQLLTTVRRTSARLGALRRCATCSRSRSIL